MSILPTAAKAVPAGPDWLHEIKYDGYRLRVERNGKEVRLITRNGHNWTDRYPWIVASALKNREQQFVVEGEAVVLGVDGISDFNALHSRKHDEEVQFYASTSSPSAARTCGAAAVNAQDQPGAAAARQARRHVRRTIRVVRSGRICLEPHATSASRASSPSGGTGATSAAERASGSR